MILAGAGSLCSMHHRQLLAATTDKAVRLGVAQYDRDSNLRRIKK
jgi:hypothetical protein